MPRDGDCAYHALAQGCGLPLTAPELQAALAREVESRADRIYHGIDLAERGELFADYVAAMRRGRFAGVLELWLFVAVCRRPAHIYGPDDPYETWLARLQGRNQTVPQGFGA